MLGLKNMREQCFLIAAVQNMKRLAKAFSCCVTSSYNKSRASSYGNTAFVDGLRAPA